MSSSPDRPRRQRAASGSTSRSTYTSPPGSRRRRETMSSIQSASTFDSAEEEWEGDGGQEDVGNQRRRKKRDEPMSPVTVVFYVTALYFIFQILTRSDELEILSHLPPTSSLFSSPLGLGGSNLHSDLSRSQHPYQMPYHLPQIPSPLPPVADAASTSLSRMILGVLIYPFYLLITLLAIPVPYLLTLLQLVVSVLATVLSPLTSSARFLLKTFVIAPLSVLRSVLAVFYPLYTFVGGVIGFGCIMGLGAGWIGRVSMDWLVYSRQSKPDKSKRPVKRSTAESSRKKREEGSQPSRLRIDTRRARSPDSSSDHDLRILTPSVPNRPIYVDRPQMERNDSAQRQRERDRYGKKADYSQMEMAGFGDEMSYRDVRASGREPHVLGTRRRSHLFGER